MKKGFILLSILSVLLFASCSSIPKTVKAGDTLAIGNIKCVMVGYKGFEDVKTNGTFTEGIELTITDMIQNREVKTVQTDKNGFFAITGLKPHGSYCISKLKVTLHGNSGAYFSTWIDFTPQNRRSFISYDSSVVDLGTTTFSFNGNTSSVYWSYDGYLESERLFKQAAEESEWKNKKIYQQQLLLRRSSIMARAE